MIGLTLEQGLKAVQTYRSQSAWLGIYECAPKFDPIHHDSARYAALLIYHYLHAI
jgi:predicted neuraminidase